MSADQIGYCGPIHRLVTTTVYLLLEPPSISDFPWLVAAKPTIDDFDEDANGGDNVDEDTNGDEDVDEDAVDEDADGDDADEEDANGGNEDHIDYDDKKNMLYFFHPLTLKRQPWKLPANFDLTKLERFPIVVSHNIRIKFDKILVVPPWKSTVSNTNLSKCSFLGLCDGGHLWVCHSTRGKNRYNSSWIKLTQELSYRRFDDIIVYQGSIYALDRQGRVTPIHNYRTKKVSLGKFTFIEAHWSVQLGWRKRFVLDVNQLYMVVRIKEKMFVVYKLMSSRKARCWRVVRDFGNRVLYMAKDYYFFWRVSAEFREYKNSIVFCEAAFPRYGKDCWEFQNEDNIAVFRLTDNTFAREGKRSVFPKIDWSPPPWIFSASFDDDLYICSDVEVNLLSTSESQSESKRESDDDDDSSSGGKEDGGVQTDLNDPNSKDEGDEGMESEEDNQEQEYEGMEVDLSSQIQEVGEKECNSNCLEMEGQEMQSNANIGGGAPLQEDDSPSVDTVKASLSGAGEEVTTTLLSLSDETSKKNITLSELRVCTSSSIKTHVIGSGTTKFEGYDIRSDLVPTLQKIWRKHGNIVKNSIIHSGDIVSRALESLGKMVQILEDNSVQSLSDCQADYLSSTLSDLRCMCFKVSWLISPVEKVVELHKIKPLLISLNNLKQLSSQVKERRAVLVDELAKISEEENKLKEEMAKVSKSIPFYGQVKFDEPIGLGLT